MQYLHYRTTSKYLVSKSQDKIISNAMCKNLDEDKVNIQINIEFLAFKLNKDQLALLAKILKQVITNIGKI